MNEDAQLAIFILLCIGLLCSVVAISITLCGKKVSSVINTRLYPIFFGIIVLDITAGNIHWYITSEWSEGAQTAVVVIITVFATLFVVCCNLMLIAPITIGLGMSWIVRSWFPASMSSADAALASFVVFLITVVILISGIMLLEYCYLAESDTSLLEVVLTSWIVARLLILIATNPSEPWVIYQDVDNASTDQLDSLWTVVTWVSISLIRMAIPLAICCAKRKHKTHRARSTTTPVIDDTFPPELQLTSPNLDMDFPETASLAQDTVDI